MKTTRKESRFRRLFSRMRKDKTVTDPLRPAKQPERNGPGPLPAQPPLPEEEASGQPVFDPARQTPVCVYGPPEWFRRKAEAFDPAEEVPAEVYGPPEWFGAPSEEDPEEAVPDGGAEEVSEAEESAPVPLCRPGAPASGAVSGALPGRRPPVPPRPFRPGVPVTADFSEPVPPDFDPAQNIAVPVYGPPAGEPPAEDR